MASALGIPLAVGEIVEAVRSAAIQLELPFFVPYSSAKGLYSPVTAVTVPTSESTKRLFSAGVEVPTCA